MKTVTLPEAVIFGTMIGLGLTGFLLACEAVQVAAMCMKAQRGGAAWSKGKNG